MLRDYRILFPNIYHILFMLIMHFLLYISLSYQYDLNYERINVKT